MKKILFLLALLPCLLHAQIGQIQTKEKPYEFITNIVFHDKTTDTYYLHCQSDNQFEDDVIRVKIGESLDESVASFVNLLAVFQSVGEQFDLGRYTFNIKASYIQAVKKGDLYYTAGEYRINDYQIKNAIKKMILLGADPGRITIEVPELGLVGGKLVAHLVDYNFDVKIELGTNLKQYLARRYETGELLDPQDICALNAAMDRGEITVNRYIMSACKNE